MPQCSRCKKFLPPHFIEVEYSDGGKICIFCEMGIDKINYDKNKIATKDEIVKEYHMFLNKVKEHNEILKNTLKGDRSEVPEKIR